MLRLFVGALCIGFACSFSAKMNVASKLYDPTFIGPSPIWFSPEMLNHGRLLLQSYTALTGKELVSSALLKSDPDEAAKSLFLMYDRVVLSHGTQKEMKDGPILNYGNTAALRRWGASWEQLTTMPSRYTAEALERAERDKFMMQVTANGVVDDYAGVRIALDGTKFRIERATVWNIVVDNIYYGQAATFPI